MHGKQHLKKKLFPCRSSIVGLPKVKRDKYSVFNFLTLSEPTTSVTQETNERKQENNSVSSKSVVFFFNYVAVK